MEIEPLAAELPTYTIQLNSRCGVKREYMLNILSRSDNEIFEGDTVSCTMQKSKTVSHLVKRLLVLTSVLQTTYFFNDFRIFHFHVTHIGRSTITLATLEYVTFRCALCSVRYPCRESVEATATHDIDFSRTFR